MTREEATDLVRKHGNQRAAARAAGISRTTFRRALNGEPNRIGVNLAARPTAYPAVAARSLLDFRNTYDLNTIVPKKIAAGFKLLGSGWMYENEFAKAAGLTLKDLGMFRDAYIEHIVVVSDSRRVWAGKKDVAQEMRAML